MGFLSTIFDPGNPYKQAMKPIKKYYGEARGYQDPFYQSGKSAIPEFQSWLGGMQDPAQFINQQMGQYQESPWAKYQQQQAMRAAQNMGSASGLIGSTPMMQFAQQNARDIASQDQNQWLQNVLGINQMYGQGLGGMMQSGQHAGDLLSQLAMQQGDTMAGLNFGKNNARYQGFWNALGSLGFNNLGQGSQQVGGSMGMQNSGGSQGGGDKSQALLGLLKTIFMGGM